MATRKSGGTKKPARVPQKDPGTAPVCETCLPAKCCMYFSTEIDRPEEPRDFDDILWMIAHRDVEIYTIRRRWYLMVKTPCRFYDPARGCLIYPARPRICRRHNTRDCEFNDAYDFDQHFHSYEDLERYVRKRFSR